MMDTAKIIRELKRYSDRFGIPDMTATDTGFPPSEAGVRVVLPSRLLRAADAAVETVIEHQTDDGLQCSLCGAVVSGVEAAIDKNWLPSFFVGDNGCYDPCCNECAEKYFTFDDGGEFELRPDSPRPWEWKEKH